MCTSKWCLDYYNACGHASSTRRQILQVSRGVELVKCQHQSLEAADLCLQVRNLRMMLLVAYTASKQRLVQGLLKLLPGMPEAAVLHNWVPQVSKEVNNVSLMRLKTG